MPGNNEFDPTLFDKRTVQRYVRRGQVAEKDVERYLKQLPDVAEKADTIKAEPPASDAGPAR